MNAPAVRSIPGVSPLGEMTMGVGVLIAGFVVAVIGFSQCGCTPAYDPASYARDDSACVVEAGTRAEADACRAEVRARYGVPPRDGGAEGGADRGSD